MGEGTTLEGAPQELGPVLFPVLMVVDQVTTGVPDHACTRVLLNDCLENVLEPCLFARGKLCVHRVFELESFKSLELRAIAEELPWVGEDNLGFVGTESLEGGGFLRKETVFPLLCLRYDVNAACH